MDAVHSMYRPRPLLLPMNDVPRNSQYCNAGLMFMFLEVSCQRLRSNLYVVLDIRRMQKVERSIIEAYSYAGMTDVEPFLACRNSNEIAGLNFRL